MRKFINVLVVIVKVLIICYLCFSLVYISVAASQKEIDNKFYLVPPNSNYGINPVWLSDGNDTVINDIYDQLSTIGSKSAAYKMYETACKKLMLTKAYGLRASSIVSVSAGDLVVDVLSNRIEAYKVVGTPVLNANQKVESSYQNTVYVTKVSDPALSGILQKAVQIANRGYIIGQDRYIQSGKLSAMDDGGEVISWPQEYQKEVLTAERKYKDSDIREKSNFIITPDTMLDNAKISREYDEKQKMYFYTIDIELDCSDSWTEGTATYYEAKAIGDLLGSNMKSLVYNQMKITMTMYENGYLIDWYSLQEWTLTYKVAFLSATGVALSEKSEIFTYDPKDCPVVNFTE
ncbi:MAG: hypothetical protein GX242_04360 [Clostridiales bacterium]|nr:hypothetical protein [Clostridiales bacterium]